MIHHVKLVRGGFAPQLVAPHWRWAYRGLVGAWLMNENSGTPRELLTGYAGTPTGGAWMGSRYGPGWSTGGAFGERLTISTYPGFASFTPSQLTLESWAYIVNDNDARIISCGQTPFDDQDHDWMLSENSTAGPPYGRMRFRLRTGSTTTTLVADTGNTPNTLRHWCAVYDGVDMQLWEDGFLIKDTPKTGTVADRGLGIAIGNNPDGAAVNEWNAPILLVAVYSRALTPAEIRQKALDPFGPFRPSRIVGQRFERWRDLTPAAVAGRGRWEEE